MARASIGMLALTTAIVGSAPAQTPRLDVATLLATYDRGKYSEVVQEVEAVQDVRTLDDLDQDLHDYAGRWIESVPAGKRRRRAFIAGAVAAEVTRALSARESWQTLNRPNNHSRLPRALPDLGHYIAEQLTGTADNLGQIWTLTCLSTWQEWGITAGSDWVFQHAVGWAYLTGERRLLTLLPVPDRFGSGGFLRDAANRFPGNSRIALAQVEAHEAIETQCPAGFCYEEKNPTTLEDLNRRAKTAPPERPASTVLRLSHEFARANLAAFDRMAPIAAEFAALAEAHPEVRAEALLHIGYLALRAGRPDAALPPLKVPAASDDAYLGYLAEQFMGRALEMLGRREDAIAAYRRALSHVPNAPSAATLLASQLFLSDRVGEREEANTVLRASLAAQPRPIDPLDLYWHGDARLRRFYMERLQRALREEN